MALIRDPHIWDNREVAGLINGEGILGAAGEIEDEGGERGAIGTGVGAEGAVIAGVGDEVSGAVDIGRDSCVHFGTPYLLISAANSLRSCAALSSLGLPFPLPAAQPQLVLFLVERLLAVLRGLFRRLLPQVS